MKKIPALIAFFLILCSIMTVSAAADSQAGVTTFAIDGVGTALIPNGLNFANSVGTETMKNIETQYDLTGVGTNGSHYARLIIYKDARDMGPVLALVDLVDFKPELVSMLSNTGKKIVSQKLEENGAKLIEWLPATKISVQKHNGIQLGSRFTLSEKFPIPMFAAVVVYPQDGKLTGIALMCPDSDRLYWQPVFAQVIGSLSN